MVDDTCDCAVDATATNPETDGGRGPVETVDRWIDEEPVTEATLPPDVRTTLGRFLGVESVETLDEWVEAIRRQTGGKVLDPADLCHADGETPHWGELDGERYHFLCFFDAVILAALADSAVDVRTESPDGTVVEARAVGSDGLTITPEDAVVSFGIASDVAAPDDDGPAVEDAYAAVCPYVKAFPDREAYEQWAETAPAATVATTFAGSAALAERFAE